VTGRERSRKTADPTHPARDETQHAGQQTDRPGLAKLRHDLRTPLNAILGYSDMILEDSAQLDQPDFVADLRQLRVDGARLLSGVDAILDVSPLLLGELSRPIAVVLTRGERLQESALGAGLAELAPDLERIVLAARRFQALLDGLVASSEGATISTPQHEWAGRSSEAGTLRELDEKTPPARTAPGTLLVVDDSELNRDVLTRRLERQGHAVRAVANGREALEALSKEQFDLVLLDIMMPGIDGFEVLRRLKADAVLRDLPVIVISALEEIDSAVRCIEMGAEDYLPKPFDPILLKARIGASLEKKRLRDHEVAYLRAAARVTQAAAAVEAGAFDPEDLNPVRARPDALGQLARVFVRMAGEVRAREQRLKREVQQLRIEIDEARTSRQVAEITETEYFQALEDKVEMLRAAMLDP
jgi:CheY-like chemotaxis protein